MWLLMFFKFLYKLTFDFDDRRKAINFDKNQCKYKIFLKYLNHLSLDFGESK